MSDNSFTGILNRMKDRLETEADRREGTWTADNLQAVANEIARLYSEDIESILPQAFVSTATGENLDLACDDYGIARRSATYAEALLEVSGEPGMYYGLTAYAGEVPFHVPDPFSITGGEPVFVRAVCGTAGEAGNVAAGSIDKASLARVTKVTNPEDARGGYDGESDRELRERTLEHIRTPANSGNIAHYIQWAKEVPGVHKVRVYDLARGPGTVDVAIIADGNVAAPQKLLLEVEGHIEEVRPIGADVRVVSAEAVGLDISATAIVQKGHTRGSVESSFLPLLQGLCERLAFQSGTVSYLGIANLLFDCPGVVDIGRYSINGMEKSIQLQAKQFPVPGIVEITVQEESDA